MLKIKNAMLPELLQSGKEFKALKTPIPVIVRLAWDKSEEVLIKHYHNHEKARVAICEKYADKDDTGKPIVINDREYRISDENMKLVNPELKALLQQDVEVPDYRLQMADIPKDFSFSNVDFPHYGVFMKYVFKD